MPIFFLYLETFKILEAGLNDNENEWESSNQFLKKKGNFKVEIILTDESAREVGSKDATCQASMVL